MKILKAIGKAFLLSLLAIIFSFIGGFFITVIHPSVYESINQGLVTFEEAVLMNTIICSAVSFLALIFLLSENKSKGGKK